MNKLKNKTTFIFSPKHRTGKTTIANYLALKFAKKDYLTAVIELDRNYSYSPFLNNTLNNSERSLKNIAHGESIEKNFMQSSHDENLFIASLCMNDELLDLHKFPKEYICNTLNFAKEKFDKVFIDLPTGYLENGLMYAINHDHDQTIVVLDDDMSCLHALKLYDLMFNQIGVNLNNIITVLNKSHGLINDKLLKSFNDNLHVLKSNKTCVIPYMADIIKAGNEGKMLCDIQASDRTERQLVSSLNELVSYIEFSDSDCEPAEAKQGIFSGIIKSFTNK